MLRIKYDFIFTVDSFTVIVQSFCYLAHNIRLRLATKNIGVEMKRVIRCMALAIAVSANVGITNAAHHTFGEYSTAVAESRLFITDSVSTTLRCDLFFSAVGNGEKLIAPKGTVVSQTVPAFVWQYSGLLPVSDYLKTVAIHSVSSERQERSWQDVQLSFYNGLRVEGVRETDAKIAYAGAYAFAPRWPLVELVDITVPERDKETRLYSVKYTPVEAKGVSVSDYQALASDILAAPDSVSLQDIRGVIAAADAALTGQETSQKDSILDVFFKDKKEMVSDPIDDLFIDEAPLPALTPPDATSDAMDVAEDNNIASNSMDAAAPGEKAAGMEEVAVTDQKDLVEGIIVEIDTDLMGGSSPLKNEAARKDVWKKMPDGSEWLVQVGS